MTKVEEFDSLHRPRIKLQSSAVKPPWSGLLIVPERYPERLKRLFLLAAMYAFANLIVFERSE